MATATAGGAVHLVRCAVGGTAVGFDLARVAGVERGERVTPCDDVPGAVGQIMTRGATWPVYPLAWWLGVEAETAGRGQVVLLDTPRGKLGVLVDRVSQAARVDRAKVFPPPTAVGTAGDLVVGVVLFDAGPLLVLDPDRLDPTDSTPAESRPQLPPPVHRPVRQFRGSDRLLALAWGELPGASRRPVALGLPAASVAEIVPAGETAAAPASDGHVRGVVAWRGRPLTLFDAAAWVGLPSPPLARVVVASVGGVRVALASGPEVRLLSAGTPVVAARHAPAVRADRVRGVVDATDVTLVIPEWDRLVTSDARA